MDWNHIGLLLHIVEKAKDHPKLAALTNAALAELDQHAKLASEVKHQESKDEPTDSE